MTWRDIPENLFVAIMYPVGSVETAKELAKNDQIISKDFSVPWNKVSRQFKFKRKSAHRTAYKKMLQNYEHHYGKVNSEVDRWIEWLRTPLHNNQ